MKNESCMCLTGKAVLLPGYNLGAHNHSDWAMLGGPLDARDLIPAGSMRKQCQDLIDLGIPKVCETTCLRW